MTDTDFERKKRYDLVWGVVIASAIGFVLNLLASLYFGFFITKTLQWNQVNHLQVYGLAFALLGLIGFLQFIIEDYQNELELDKDLFGRFAKYFFYEFRPGRVLRVIVGTYVLFILAGFLLIPFGFLAGSLGVIPTTAIYVVVAIAGVMTYRGRGKRVTVKN